MESEMEPSENPRRQNMLKRSAETRELLISTGNELIADLQGLGVAVGDGHTVTEAVGSIRETLDRLERE